MSGEVNTSIAEPLSPMTRTESYLRPLPTDQTTQNTAPGHKTADILLIAVQWHMHLRQAWSPLRVLDSHHMTSKNDIG